MREDNALELYFKIKNTMKLSDSELELLNSALNNPLNEFCKRQGVWRLVNFHNVEEEEAQKHEEDAQKCIEDAIDESFLSDAMDEKLHWIAEEIEND